MLGKGFYVSSRLCHVTYQVEVSVLQVVHVPHVQILEETVEIHWGQMVEGTQTSESLPSAQTRQVLSNHGVGRGRSVTRCVYACHGDEGFSDSASIEQWTSRTALKHKRVTSVMRADVGGNAYAQKVLFKWERNGVRMARER